MEVMEGKVNDRDLGARRGSGCHGGQGEWRAWLRWVGRSRGGAGGGMLDVHPIPALVANFLSDPRPRRALPRPTPPQVLQGGVNLLEKVDELKKRSEDLKKDAQVRKRQEEEQKRRLQELEVQQMDVDKK